MPICILLLSRVFSRYASPAMVSATAQSQCDDCGSFTRSLPSSAVVVRHMPWLTRLLGSLLLWNCPQQVTKKTVSFNTDTHMFCSFAVNPPSVQVHRKAAAHAEPVMLWLFSRFSSLLFFRHLLQRLSGDTSGFQGSLAFSHVESRQQKGSCKLASPVSPRNFMPALSLSA